MSRMSKNATFALLCYLSAPERSLKGLFDGCVKMSGKREDLVAADCYVSLYCPELHGNVTLTVHLYSLLYVCVMYFYVQSVK